MPDDPEQPERRRTPSWPLVAIVVALVLAGVGAGVLLAGGSDESDDSSSAAAAADLQTVTFQEPEDPGPDPFTEPADVEGDEAVTIPASGTGGEQPFGGSGSNRVCDRDRLIRFLKRNPERMREWARVLGIEPTYRAVRRYIAKLHPVTLTRDTQVTNHAFVDGRAVPFQAILQAGTAVLVDRYGTPVVRCYCGNPLTPAVYVKTAKCSGCPPDYRPPRPCRFGRRANYDRTYYRRDYYENGDYDEVFIRSHRRSPYRNCYRAYPDPPVVRIVDVYKPPRAQPARTPSRDGTAIERPSASFSPGSGGQSTPFTLSVSGFAPNTTLNVLLTRPDGVRENYSIRTGSGGSGSHYFPAGGTRVRGTYLAVITNPRTGARAQASATVVGEQHTEPTPTAPEPTPEPTPAPEPQHEPDSGLQCNPPRSQLEFEQCAEQ